MHFLKSIRVRIIALYMTILLLTLSTFGFVLFRDLSRRLRGDIDRLLESRARGVADSVEIYWETEKLEASRDLKNALALSKINNANFVKIAQRWVMDRTDDPDMLNMVVQIFDIKGEQIASSKDMPDMRILPPNVFDAILQGKRRFDDLLTGQAAGNPVSMRALAIPVIESKRVAYIIRVLSPLTSLDSMLNNFRFIVFILLPIAVLLSGVAGSVMASVTFGPINRIIETIHKITAENLRLRVAVPESKDEIQKLADTFNDMLARLEHAFTSQRQFIEDLTHELKTPLAVLKGELEVTLKRIRSAGEYESVLESNLEEIDRIIRIVENLLILARLEKDVAALDKEDLDAGDLVGQCIEYVQILAEQKAMRVSFESAGGMSIRGDVGKLKQLFFNVLDNAIKFTPRGGGVGVRVAQEGRWIRVTVRDTGPGIPEKDMPRIFDRFFRGRGSSSKEGVGLGMPIAKAIAEAHGGRVEVASAIGQGTCFDIFLPARLPGLTPDVIKIRAPKD